MPRTAPTQGLCRGGFVEAAHINLLSPSHYAQRACPPGHFAQAPLARRPSARYAPVVCVLACVRATARAWTSAGWRLLLCRRVLASVSGCACVGRIGVGGASLLMESGLRLLCLCRRRVCAASARVGLVFVYLYLYSKTARGASSSATSSVPILCGENETIARESRAIATDLLVTTPRTDGGLRGVPARGHKPRDVRGVMVSATRRGTPAWRVAPRACVRVFTYTRVLGVVVTTGCC